MVTYSTRPFQAVTHLNVDRVACIGHLNHSVCLRIFDIKSSEQRNIQALSMNCCRATLDISYIDHVINDAVRRTIKEESVTLEDVVTILKKRKLKWYRHVVRDNKPSALGKKRRRKQKEKRHWVDWKNILSGKQPNPMEETGCMLRSSEILRSHPFMGMRMMKWRQAPWCIFSDLS